MTNKEKIRYAIGITLVITFAVAMLFVAMYVSGYDIVTWFSKFYPWVIVAGCLLTLAIISYMYIKIRK